MKGYIKIKYGAYLILLAVVFVLGTLFGNKGGAALPRVQVQNNGELPNPVNTSLINEVWNIVHKKYVGKVEDQDLATGMLRGLVAGLGDPYSAFADKDETNQFEEDISGRFSGIGVEIGRKNGLVTVISPLKNSPAEKAGIKAQDIIYSVDGKNIPTDMTLSEVASKIRGPVGSSVKLGIIREKQEGTIDVTVRREKIQLESVTSEVRDGIGIINLSVFHDDTAQRFNGIARQMLTARVKGIVLDMRNNPGGVLNGAVEIASHFVNEGDIVVKEVPADPSKAIEHRAEGPADLARIPIVVLVNGGSASAAEIMAGALRDLRSAKIVGEKTFGKGTVQELVKLSDGSSMRITIAKWLTPNGDEIAEKGISPDVQVEQGENEKIDDQLDRALAIIKTQVGQ